MKNRGAIISLFTANTISGIAQGISMIAIPWFFAKNHDMANFGLVYLFATAISLIWVPYCGTLVDKYDRKHIFVVISFLTGLIVLGISSISYWQSQISTFWVGAVFIITFLNYNIHYPTLYAFVQEISEPKYQRKIVSLLEIQGQSTSMLAGAVAAILLEGTENGLLDVFGYSIDLGIDLEIWSIQEIFLIDGVTYILSLILISTLSYVSLTERPKEVGSIISRFKFGIQYLKENKEVFVFFLVSFAVFIAILIDAFYLGAIYVVNHLESKGTTYGAGKMFYAIGAILSGVLIGRLLKKIFAPFSIIVLTIFTALLYLVLFYFKSDQVFFLILFLLGLTNAGIRVLRVIFMYKIIPNQFFGRINSTLFWFTILIRLILLSVVSLPFFSIGNNVKYGYLVLSMFLLVSSIILLFNYKKIKKHII